MTQSPKRSAKAPAKKAPAKKASGKKASAKAPAKKAPAKKAPAKKAPAKKGTPTSEVETVAVAPPGPDAGADPRESSSGDWFGEAEEDLWGGDWDDLEAPTDGSPGRSGTDAPPTDPGRQFAADGVELFQHAAFELIAAARNALDAAEQLVADPSAIGLALESVRDIAGEVVRAAKPRARPGTASRVEPADDGFESIFVDDA